MAHRHSAPAAAMTIDLKHAEDTPAGRRRLSGRTTRRGVQTGFSTRGTVLFGVPFVGAGAGIILVGTRVIPVDPSSVHAPYWVLTMVGLVFGFGGLWAWGMAWKQYASRRRQQEAMRRHTGVSAFADYAWDPHGFEAARWQTAGHAVGGAVILTLFLSVFNYWAFGAGGPWPVKALVVLFDLIAVAAWWEAGLRLGRALKFGGSRIVFDRFPYPQSEPIVIRWVPADGIDQARNGAFTLRCVEEWFESSGSGEDRSTTMVHEEIWRETWRFDRAATFRPMRDVALRFEPPDDLPPTRLSVDRPTFWELEVKLDLPGLDFVETYLVPVYAAECRPR
ncbi:MAG: hypothetical protein A3K19_08910 [Lentisphaerae bacterium RIFOXYB12_FULL_65_16]|nr:MAG: hypothetical protein A3K18_13715 [Lentisphaerae bacterium RIFOXYA12_64_32]OGV87667.1 MAG: hypothetical protein A3K19_08910 [Lentisphaerae bacterium RIFOXYB12_FULL_65_16]